MSPATWDWIIQHYPTPNTGECAPQSEAGRYSTYVPKGAEDWVDLDGWLYTKMVLPSANSQLVTIQELTGPGVD